MKKTILIYGTLLAGLAGLLKLIEYRFLIRELSVEVYVGMIAIVFTALGVWIGLKLTSTTRMASPEQEDAGALLSRYGISDREYEVLGLIAQGHTNQEIADVLYLSINTVKTHSSNLFSKLDVNRRTQAVRRAKELGLLRK